MTDEGDGAQIFPLEKGLEGFGELNVAWRRAAAPKVENPSMIWKGGHGACRLSLPGKQPAVQHEAMKAHVTEKGSDHSP